jgi:hypothetical protein
MARLAVITANTHGGLVASEPDIRDALDLLLKPQRTVATLRA